MKSWKQTLLSLLMVVLSATLALGLSGCVMIGGYSSRGGWFLWPGSLVLTAIGLFVLALLRRGR